MVGLAISACGIGASPRGAKEIDKVDGVGGAVVGNAALVGATFFSFARARRWPIGGGRSEHDSLARLVFRGGRDLQQGRVAGRLHQVLDTVLPRRVRLGHCA